MKALIKYVAREVGFPVIHRLGIDALMSARSANNVLQITYHGVSLTNHLSFSPRSIQASVFERQLAYFKRNFDVVTVCEALDWKRNGFRPKRKTLALSFDDGYANNFTVMRPLVERYEIPVSVLVCGAPYTPSGARYLWPDLIEVMKFNNSAAQFQIAGVHFKNLRAQHNGQLLSDWIKTLLPEQRFEVLSELSCRFNLETLLKEVPSEAWEIMSAEQLISLSKSPFVEIGAHGHWHSNLGNIPLNAAVEDLKRSKETLESLLGKSIKLLAYPDGSYSRDLIDAAEELGFSHQLAVRYQYKEDVNDPRIINRHGISATTTLESTLFFLHRAFSKQHVF